MQKVHSVPYLSARQRAAELLQERCRTLVVAALKSAQKRRDDVVRLIWLLNRFERGRRLKLLRLPACSVAVFDRLCWQLAFGTFLTEQSVMVNGRFGTVAPGRVEML